ncbi:MAG: cation transporter [Clostridia bacterium]|nr:cation transporter [Clostridia bacterium]
MTTLLLRLFVKNSDDTTSNATRSAIGSLSGVVGTLCNLLLFALKLVVGTLSGSVSITADALNNLTDGASSIVTLIGFRLASKPADEEHPYGHARYEYLSALAVAAMIIVIGFELAKTSVEKIFNPSSVEFSVPVAIVLVCSIAVKLWLCLFNKKLGRRINSSALIGTSADSRNDMIATSAVLAAGLLEYFFGWQIDGYMGLLVALFILYSGAVLVKETISPLLGENASPELQADIVSVFDTCPEVLGYHDLMVHDYGPGQRFASVHVEMDAKADPLECHELIDNLERECYNRHGVSLVVHYDPVLTDDEELIGYKRLVTEALAAIDERISFHDFRMVKGNEHTNLIFDIVLPEELFGNRKVIKEKLDAALKNRTAERLYTVVEFDMEAFNR